MTEALLETLPLSHRLALSYAPGKARAVVLAVMALDMRLAGIVSGDGEPMIAQIKLAWWRDRLAEGPQQWPAGEPLLELLREAVLDLERLRPLVDGYEVLLGETFDRPALATYLRGKSLAWAAAGDAVGNGRTLAPVEQAAKELALFELSSRLTDVSEAELARDATNKQPWKPTRLSRNMRSLAVLHAMARRARSKGETNLLAGGATILTAMRVGFTGR